MVKCPFCGRENPEGSNFCYNCGHKLPKAKGKKAAVAPTPSPLLKRVTPLRMPVPSPGMCYYHPNIPASYICARCGRPVCKYCASYYNGLVLCPECYEKVSLTQWAQAYPPALTY